MAGSNQARDFTGLLNSISGSFNQDMVDVGSGWAETFRNLRAPMLDANDPQSVMARQDWAQRNGYQNEAVALGATLGNLNKAEQQEADRAEYNRMRSALTQLETQRQQALDGLTVPGGGPPSPQQVAEVNANFDRARDKLAFRIDEQAAKIEGASGTAGAEAVSNNEKARRIEDILTNNGLGDYTEMAPYMEYKDVQELMKNKNVLSGINVQRSQVYDNGTMMAVTEDGQAFLIAPGENGGKPIFSDHPDYQRLSAEASASGLTATAAEAQALQNIKDVGIQEAEADARLIETQTAMANGEFAIQQTADILRQYEQGKLDTGPWQGLLVRMGLGDRPTGELNAKAIYQGLLNLQITRLTPVTEKELQIISELWASAFQNPEQAMGALDAAMERLVYLQDMNRQAAIRDTSILTGSKQSFRQTGGQYYTDYFSGRYGEDFYNQEIPQYFGDGVNLSPGGGNTIGGSIGDGNVNDEAKNWLKGRNRANP